MIQGCNLGGSEYNLSLIHIFNSGCGTAQQLGFSVRRLAQVVEQFRQVRKLGYPYAV